MQTYSKMTQEELSVELAEQQKHYEAYCARGLKLNMARGKPAPEQLDLSHPLLDLLSSKGHAEELHAGAADDLRNYGNLTGLSHMRELMGAIMGVPAANVLIGGNSSLNMMYDTVSRAMTHGVLGSMPWARLNEKPIFLCPVPGYDRHFSVTEHFGIKMIPVPLTEEGPDMDMVEQHVNTNVSVKGIWCVPRFSNPTGCVYSDETVERFASLAPAAEDFRIYWDNAYAVHDFDGVVQGGVCADKGEGAAAREGDCAGDAALMGVELKDANPKGIDAHGEAFRSTDSKRADSKSVDSKSVDSKSVDPKSVDPKSPDSSDAAAPALMNIKEACDRAGNPNIWYQFASTSKVTFAGSGVAAMSCSEENLKSITAALAMQTIGPDKINQERHALFLPNLDAVKEHMAKQAVLIKPKFEVVQRVLSEGLDGLGVGEWTKPQGGYFISFDGKPHTAERTVRLAKEAGVVLTPAGATYPYGDDPADANIRIAPTYPGLEELELAAEVFVVCARIAALEQLINE